MSPKLAGSSNTLDCAFVSFSSLTVLVVVSNCHSISRDVRAVMQACLAHRHLLRYQQLRQLFPLQQHPASALERRCRAGLGLLHLLGLQVSAALGSRLLHLAIHPHPHLVRIFLFASLADVAIAFLSAYPEQCLLTNPSANTDTGLFI